MKKKVVIYAAWFVMILAASLIKGMQVSGQNANSIKAKEQFYVKLEEEYVKEIREMLKEKGYPNAGVMLTHTVYEDGSRGYRVQIHHRYFDKISEAQRDALIEEIEKKAFMKDEMEYSVHFG